MKLKKLKPNEADKLREWWSWLDDNRGDRAQLRRADFSDDILLTPAFAHFLKMMPEDWSSNGQRVTLSDAAMVAAILSRVKDDVNSEDSSFAKSLGMPKEDGGSRPAMSELRFQQLQKSRTAEDFFTHICRAINLLGGKVNVVSLADDILNWLTEQRFGPSSRSQERLAIRWASDYYENN